MTKLNQKIAILAVIICALVFSVSIGYYIYQVNGTTSPEIVTPTVDELQNIETEKPGILANASGEDLKQINVRHGFAVKGDTLYFVKNRTEEELKKTIEEQRAQAEQKAKADNPKAKISQITLDPNSISSSQLASWSSSKGITILADLSNADVRPINRLSSLVQDNLLFLFPCNPPSNPKLVCETSKVYQFNLENSSLTLLEDVSSSPDKESKIAELNKKYLFDELGQPFWQDIRGGDVYGIKNIYTNKDGSPSESALTGYLTKTKTGVDEKALIYGKQLAKANLNIDEKGMIIVDQAGTVNLTGSCLTEHRAISINPDKPSEQTKATFRVLSLDKDGLWDDGTARPEAEQKTWVETCGKLPEYAGKTPKELLEINSQTLGRMSEFGLDTFLSVTKNTQKTSL